MNNKVVELSDYNRQGEDGRKLLRHGDIVKITGWYDFERLSRNLHCSERDEMEKNETDKFLTFTPLQCNSLYENGVHVGVDYSYVLIVSTHEDMETEFQKVFSEAQDFLKEYLDDGEEDGDE